jgi:transposase-like protein
MADDIAGGAARGGGAPTARRYSEAEVALVIKRATELQASESQSSDAGATGLSLVELEQIAREAGIDPSLVRRAAREVDTRQSSKPASKFLGAPSVIVMERTVDGEVPTAEYEVIVDMLRRAFNDNGMLGTLGKSLAWSSTSRHGRHGNGQQVNASVTPRDGRTVIRIEQSLRATAGGLFGGLMGGIGGGTTGISVSAGMVVFHSALVAAGLWVSVVGASYLLARGIYTHVARGRSDTLREVLDQICEHVAATAVR